MSIKWRVTLAGIQIAALLLVTYILTGAFFTKSAWFFAGLFTIAINPQLLEPFYSKPVDVIGNGLTFLFAFPLMERSVAGPAWIGLAIAVAIATTLSVLSIFMGNLPGKCGRFGRAARLISQSATAKVVFSCWFILSALEAEPISSHRFWVLIGIWALIILTGSINWQAIWLVGKGSSAVCKIEGNIGPAIVLVSGIRLPPIGSKIRLQAGECSAHGVVLNRIRRADDDWAQIHITTPEDWDRIISGPPCVVEVLTEGKSGFVGSVDVGSTDRYLHFVSTSRLEVGQVVGVSSSHVQSTILYQIVSAEIERADVKGGGHLMVRVKAVQLGSYDASSQRLVRNRWVPPPGAAVTDISQDRKELQTEIQENKFLLGHVIGTNVPIFLDLNAACEGHLAILGMTKMGKTTLAVRLAHALKELRFVSILDQTGEYVTKKGLPKLNTSTVFNQKGLSVFEPKPGEVAPDRALAFMRSLLELATQEYKSAEPFPRTLLIDEAHQFIPEPAGLGFNAAGRDSSAQIGLLMMQIRKYGMSVFLISQRTAVVAKSALSQCENLIAFRSVDQTGLDYLEAIAGAEIRSLLPQLKHGEAVVFGPAISSESPVAIKVWNGLPTILVSEKPAVVGKDDVLASDQAPI